ncbi:MAG TPA: adenylate/guanylate cyclase domain-containing protein [Chloroflexota bacterium]|nr:adenylate/guanylate cyclase domain-containing protein [Chloroflexota bacterium]
MAKPDNRVSYGDSGGTSHAQTLLFARDVARMNALRRAYERLVPVPLDVFAPSLPETRVRESTILFSDIRGFTAIAERLESDPDQLLTVLNEHFRVVVRAVVRCGGTVEKFLGDGLFATFGAWADAPDHSSRALAAAIGVIGANEGLNRRRANEWGFRLEVGVALCSGRVVVGTMGPPERCELGIIGDPVNVAARLAQVAGASEVLLSESAYHAVSDQVSADLLGTRPIRGRVGALSLYRLRFGSTG